MAKAKSAPAVGAMSISKSPTGISGFDQITGGGLPKGRTALFCGAAGCGKTLFALEFILQGVLEYNEPGVFVAFEETVEDLAQNVASLGFNLNSLIAQKKLIVDYIHLERSEIEETGEYDLEGLFIRLEHAIDSIGAKRVALDTIEALFAALSDTFILRSELRRLFRWLKDKKVTSVITGERGVDTLTRQGLEEYVSDCVVLLDTRMNEQIVTRRLRIIKYRGSTHGLNEYPFLINEHGISVLPITSLALEHTASRERISSGVERLDALLGDGGYFRGTSILVSGTAGVGKTSLAAHFADATCRRGERCLYFASEESAPQIIENMHSIGIHLEQWVDNGLLKYNAARPTLYGLENHLSHTYHLVNEFQPQAVIIDPVTNFLMVGTMNEVKAMLMRIIDFLKTKQITTLITSLTPGGSHIEKNEVGISSLIDTWLLLRDLEANGERNRGMYILKSRGMAHSNQIREFVLTDHGVELIDVYVGAAGVLTGSSRLIQEAQDRVAALTRKEEVQRLQLRFERKQKMLDAQILALRAEFEAETDELNRAIAQQQLEDKFLVEDLNAVARKRRAIAHNDKRE